MACEARLGRRLGLAQHLLVAAQGRRFMHGEHDAAGGCRPLAGFERAAIRQHLFERPRPARMLVQPPGQPGGARLFGIGIEKAGGMDRDLAERHADPDETGEMDKTIDIELVPGNQPIVTIEQGETIRQARDRVVEQALRLLQRRDVGHRADVLPGMRRRSLAEPLGLDLQPDRPAVRPDEPVLAAHMTVPGDGRGPMLVEPPLVGRMDTLGPAEFQHLLETEAQNLERSAIGVGQPAQIVHLEDACRRPVVERTQTVVGVGQRLLGDAAGGNVYGGTGGTHDPALRVALGAPDAGHPQIPARAGTQPIVERERLARLHLFDAGEIGGAIVGMQQVLHAAGHRRAHRGLVLEFQQHPERRRQGQEIGVDIPLPEPHPRAFQRGLDDLGVAIERHGAVAGGDLGQQGIDVEHPVAGRGRDLLLQHGVQARGRHRGQAIARARPARSASPVSPPSPLMRCVATTVSRSPCSTIRAIVASSMSRIR